MTDLSLGSLALILLALLALSAFFSGTETALMSINRYRLRHQANAGHTGARLADQLLAKPDRLIGLILLGNTLATSFAAALVGIMALRVGGEAYALAGVTLYTVVVIILGELAPKTYGALYPERLALPSAYVYHAALRVLWPIVWVTNLLANGVLRLLGVSAARTASHSLSTEELRTVVAEASALIPHRHQRMLMSILDLEKITVDDLMIPRNDIAGIDITADWDDVLEQLRSSPHTRLPVYEGSLDKVIGILHMKKVAHALAQSALSRESLLEIALAREPYFVPEGTTLNAQLHNFQRQRRRIALVVDEYGDLQGLVTLEDILEEIVGEFTTDPTTLHRHWHRESDGSYVLNGGDSVRILNRSLGWNLPTSGPRTLNGLIVEYLETIPEPGTSLRLGDYSIEILQTMDNAVKTARLRPLSQTSARSERTR